MGAKTGCTNAWFPEPTGALTPTVNARAGQPFTGVVATVDGLYMQFLVGRGRRGAGFRRAARARLYRRASDRGDFELAGMLIRYWVRWYSRLWGMITPAGPPEGIEFVNEPVGEFAKRLRAQPGKDIWMMGGGEIAGAFLDEGEMDEFRLTMIPVFIGEGIPLLGARKRSVALQLRAIQKFADGVVRVTYAVERGTVKGEKRRGEG